MFVNTHVRTIRHDGLSLYVEDQGEAPLALVFLHLWGGSSRTWAAVVEALVGHFRCVTIDLRGWGRSDKHANDYSLFAQADDVQRVIAALDLHAYVLVGHSMGGKIAQIVAARRPKGLQGLALVAPAPPTPLDIPTERKAAMLEGFGSPDGLRQFLGVLSRRPLSTAQEQAVAEDIAHGAEAAKRAWIETGSQLDISDRVGQIDVPVKVILGASDRWLGETDLRATIEPWLPQARFEILEGVGHLSPLEAPRSVAEAIVDFLAA